jgi:hypothetical protein
MNEGAESDQSQIAIVDAERVTPLQQIETCHDQQVVNRSEWHRCGCVVQPLLDELRLSRLNPLLGELT